ncbi:MauE/DoxX family redox-associated membrane protein [Singulisphaera acidiphila]|uniref:Methylamine utilisation protein MauE domain-containing protein n=1 Tax=Singulisphaera acidiphila (strain ATCC BAA-1392 / DSM 18658 / VKM B-2454 / MOB10) TaxID=886293 RepID=L0DEE5_SINAD|nr:MauE/DoxX family redox-associated membrane protein [Singulisphaera acidiphila]AGA27198.1 hypothetical protein Sinac_2912 [Singulisphaera acidiphila DSM 18658]
MDLVAFASNDAGRIRDRLRIALGLATLVMLVLSWPLWTNRDGFPRVPFVAGFPELMGLASFLAFAALLAALAFTTAGIAWRGSLTLGLGILLVLILGDQHRFQPWAYQFLMIGLLLVCLPPAHALTYGRWWFAALYVYSGLSKLDVSFCNELGNLFLVTAVRPLGLEPAAWPAPARMAAILAMPLWEIGVAVALIVPKTRRLGLAAALVLHTALLWILGPWGLRHSTIVLVWNGAMMVEVAILFGSTPAVSDEGDASKRRRWVGIPARVLFWAAVILPLGERWGWLDAWPGHALYASHVERTEVFLHDAQWEELTPELQSHLQAPGPDSWRRFDLTAWSRAARGVPVYPQGRACNGLAEAIAARYGGRLLIKVVQWGHADRWTGRRSRVECLGLEAIRRLGNGYRLNSHPAG